MAVQRKAIRNRESHQRKNPTYKVYGRKPSGPRWKLCQASGNGAATQSQSVTSNRVLRPRERLLIRNGVMIIHKLASHNNPFAE